MSPFIDNISFILILLLSLNTTHLLAESICLTFPSFVMYLPPAFLKSLTTDSVADRSYIDKDVKVTTDSKIITLSTCDAKLRSNRYIVLAVLTEIDGQSAG